MDMKCKKCGEEMEEIWKTGEKTLVSLVPFSGSDGYHKNGECRCDEKVSMVP